jgi:hypothetical protein
MHLEGRKRQVQAGGAMSKVKAQARELVGSPAGGSWWLCSGKRIYPCSLMGPAQNQTLARSRISLALSWRAHERRRSSAPAIAGRGL